MRVLGVDPGSVVTGYGVVDSDTRGMLRVSSGVIVMRSGDALSGRLGTIYSRLIEVIDAYHPDAFCIETAFYGKNVQSTLKLGHVRGVAMLAAVHRDLEVAEYSPREIKRAVTGSGAASKHQIAYMVRNMLGIEQEFTRSDEADGLAIAICHCGQARQGSRTSASRSTWTDFVKSNPDRVRA